MEIEWAVIEEFPDYLISSEGDVVNKHSGRWMHLSETAHGVVKVGLVLSGKQHTRSVKVLVAENFVPGQDEVFDTPVHLNGDRTNNRADNLAWRPRWFAWEYARQFSNITEKERIGPLRDIDNDERYFDIVECATLNGLLFKDIRKALVLKESVFPTFQRFEMV
jgi:hypothetical protein